MKILLFVFSLLILQITGSFAQDFTIPVAKTNFQVGPYLGLKAGVNGGKNLDGRKNAFSFNGIPDFGASAFYYFDQDRTLGLACDLGMSSYTFGIKNIAGNKNFTEKFSYITLNPGFYFWRFVFGFNFGIPVSGSYGSDISTSKLSPLVELRLAGVIPVFSDETGTLNVNIQGGYMLTGVFKDFGQNDPLMTEIPPVPPQMITSSFNPRVVSLSVGISYLFNINLKSKPVEASTPTK
jgi:hypothetical protein